MLGSAVRVAEKATNCGRVERSASSMLSLAMDCTSSSASAIRKVIREKSTEGTEAKSTMMNSCLSLDIDPIASVMEGLETMVGAPRSRDTRVEMLANVGKSVEMASALYFEILILLRTKFPVFNKKEEQSHITREVSESVKHFRAGVGAWGPKQNLPWRDQASDLGWKGSRISL